MTLNHQKTEIIGKKRKRPELSSSSSSSSSLLLDLPQELITDIISHVVSSSFTDFFTIKSTCKKLYEISKEEDYIYRQICLEKFPVVPWQNREKHSQFFKRCHANKNPKALYREGTIQFFRHSRLELAIKYLAEAKASGNMEAYYAMGVVYILSGEEFNKQKGIAILGGIRKSKAIRNNLKDYRQSLKLIVTSIWTNPLIKKNKTVCCTVNHHHQKQKKKKRKTTAGWPIDDEIEEEEDDEDEDENLCEACASDLEIKFISRFLI